MGVATIAEALQRVTAVLARRPEAGLHDDAAATAHWQGGTRVVARHANGREMPTDMPGEFGGTGDQVSPGWLFRAGVASCAATSIAMLAASEGIELDLLEARVDSKTDSRGMLGMADADGSRVSAAPCDLQLRVRIGARGAAPEQLRGLVERGCGRSPIPCAVEAALPLALHITVADA
ncbi:MAG: OsmC family peroxiredoxin [Variovorax sp.]|nr:MAG: OsmC family peroxiredoxin [Variovorax sp.]